MSQDNRGSWQRQQDKKNADAAYKQYTEDKKTKEGVQNLNGFITFADYATLGLGAGSLLAKGAKHIGKRLLNQAAKGFANSRNMGIVAQPFQRGGFTSELDWTPKSWFEQAGNWKRYTQADIDALASHVPEYHQIEQAAKANGTWLKLPNGKTWEGDARSWVQLQSKGGQKLVPERWFTGINNSQKAQNFPEFNGKVWTSNSKNMAEEWSRISNPKGTGQVYEISYPKDAKTYTIEANGNKWHELPNVFNYELSGRRLDKLSTNSAVSISEIQGNDVTKINNVLEGLGKVVDDAVIHPYVPRKSLVGNNGNFDLYNSNIYRGLTPIIGMSTLYPNLHSK